MYRKAVIPGGWRGLSVAALLLWLALALCPPIAAHAASAGVSVPTLYPITVAEYNDWGNDGFPALPQTILFPAGTAYVAFYLEYSGPIRERVPYTVHVLNRSGAVVGTSPNFTLPTTTARTQRLITYAQAGHGALAPGDYTAVMLVAGSRAATTRFTVSPSTAPLGGSVTVKTIYPISIADYNGWAKQGYPDIPWTYQFHTGAQYVAFYLEYTGPTTERLPFVVQVFNAAGAVVGASLDYTLPAVSSGTQRLITYTHAVHGGFAAGAYRVIMLVEGKQVAATQFRVS